MKRILVIAFSLLVLTGCFSKKYSIKLLDENIVFDQTYDDFSLEMLKPFVSVHLGDQAVDLDVIEIDGQVDLTKIGTYEISLVAKYKKNRSELPIVVHVVDRSLPEFHVNESELLIYKDEEVEISSDFFNLYLTDGVNGLINDRISFEGDINESQTGLYPIKLIGNDASGNTAYYDINFRVTDIIDEKAMYLYNRAIQTVHGDTLVFKDDNPRLEVLNMDQSLNVFTPNYKSHFLWLSGIIGDFNPDQSSIHFVSEEGLMYADIMEVKDKEKYIGTSLTIQNEHDTYRHYLATSTYKSNGSEVKKNFKFIIRKLEGVWLVEEFYKPY